MQYFYPPYYYQAPYRHTGYQPAAPLRNQRAYPRALQYNGASAQRNNTQQQQQNQQPSNRSSYPPVDSELLYESANQSNKLMKEASMLLDRLSSSKEFGARLMEVAQRSNTTEVERLIHSVGITSDVDINYNPDGLRLEFKSKVKDIDCCILVISLRWR